MLQELINQLEELDGKEIQIVAAGNYPNKNSTPVQHVAHYQNDGTATIDPAKFVEKAEKKAGGWKKDADKAVEKYLDGDMFALEDLGYKIAADINEAINRIRTGRLKHSMVPRVK